MKILLTAALAACIAVPAVAEPHKPANCPDLAQSRAIAGKLAEDKGLGRLDLDDDKAQAFLDAINSAQPVTAYKSAHISLLIFEPQGMALVVLADGPCGGYLNAIRINLQMAHDAYIAAMGTRM